MLDTPSNVAVESQFNVQLGSLQLQLLPDIPVSLVREGGNATPEASGIFKFSGISEGLYKFGATNLPANAYVSRLRYGDANIYDTALLHIGPGPSAPLEITLSTDGATLRGRITGSMGQPVLPRVVLIPEPPHRRNTLLYRRTEVSADGQFTFQGIAPGEYKLFAWEIFPSGAEENSAFISKYETRGTRVSIPAGATIEDVPTDLIH